ncbi:MAG: DnaJ family domain-containing protein [Sporolactobacillus sp.]
MSLIERLAEEKIQKGLREGSFENLPGKGKPQKFEDDSGVPADLRVAYKILKNAGYLPEELQLRKDLVTLTDLINCCTDHAEKEKLTGELKAKRLEFSRLMEQRSFRKTGAFRHYRNRMLDRLHL